MVWGSMSRGFALRVDGLGTDMSRLGMRYNFDLVGWMWMEWVVVWLVGWLGWVGLVVWLDWITQKPSSFCSFSSFLFHPFFLSV